MQVTKHEVDVDFKPVVITIKFTTAKELESFGMLCRMDVSIPNYLKSNGILSQNERDCLSTVMYQIAKGMG